jgi:hypothetical protein
VEIIVLYSPITEDPDLRDAIQTFRPTVLEIRKLSAELFTLGDDHPARVAIADQIQDLVGGMALRAERLAVSLDELFAQVNADLRDKPVYPDHRPEGDYLRALLDDNTRGHAAEAQAKRQLEQMQSIAVRATADRVAVDRACAGYTAGWALRGARR